MPQTAVCEEFAPGRTNYAPVDPVFVNNQKVTAYWECIAEKYNASKPLTIYKRQLEQLRKH